VYSTAGVGHGDQFRAPPGEETRHVPAHRAESLHYQACAFQFEVAIAQGDIHGVAQAPASGTDFIKRDAADLAWQGYDAADLVSDPGHAFLVRSHVRREDVLLFAAQQLGERADALFLVVTGHLRIAIQHHLAAAMRQACGCVLVCHGAGQPDALGGTDVRGHTHPADCRPLGDIIDHQYGLQVQ
jgi:hypothetical protein